MTFRKPYNYVNHTVMMASSLVATYIQRYYPVYGWLRFTDLSIHNAELH